MPDVSAADLEPFGDPEALREAYPRGYRIVGPLITRSTCDVRPDISGAALMTMMEEEDRERHDCAG